MKLSFAESIKNGFLQRTANEAVAEAGKVARENNLPPAGRVDEPTLTSTPKKRLERKVAVEVTPARPTLRKAREAVTRAVASNDR